MSSLFSSWDNESSSPMFHIFWLINWHFVRGLEWQRRWSLVHSQTARGSWEATMFVHTGGKGGRNSVILYDKLLLSLFETGPSKLISQIWHGKLRIIYIQKRVITHGSNCGSGISLPQFPVNGVECGSLNLSSKLKLRKSSSRGRLHKCCLYSV